MKKIIYLYILESMAEWKVSYILQAISMESMLKNQNVEFETKTVLAFVTFLYPNTPNLKIQTYVFNI